MPRNADASTISVVLNLTASIAVATVVPAVADPEVIGTRVFAPLGSDANHTASAREATDPLAPTQITELLEEDRDRFELLRPIPVEFRSIPGGDVEASVPGAELAFTGANPHDAKEHLQDWVVGLFDDLSDEAPDALGPRPSRQIETLRHYLRRA